MVRLSCLKVGKFGDGGRLEPIKHCLLLFGLGRLQAEAAGLVERVLEVLPTGLTWLISGLNRAVVIL